MNLFFKVRPSLHVFLDLFICNRNNKITRYYHFTYFMPTTRMPWSLYPYSTSPLPPRTLNSIECRDYCIENIILENLLIFTHNLIY